MCIVGNVHTQCRPDSWEAHGWIWQATDEVQEIDAEYLVAGYMHLKEPLAGARDRQAIIGSRIEKGL